MGIDYRLIYCYIHFLGRIISLMEMTNSVEEEEEKEKKKKTKKKKTITMKKNKILLSLKIWHSGMFLLRYSF